VPQRPSHPTASMPPGRTARAKRRPSKWKRPS
jgi:hypothetical protein